MRGQGHAPAAFYPRERSGNHCTGSWVGPRAGLDGAENLAPTGIRCPDPVAMESELPSLLDTLLILNFCLVFYELFL
jgi:hypothetical protein